MSFPDNSPYPPPAPPPRRNSRPLRKALNQQAFALGVIVLLGFVILGALLLHVSATPTRAKTVIRISSTIITGTPIIQTATPGNPGPTPTPNFVTVYRNGTPIVETATPGPPSPTYTPFPTWTPPANPSPTPIPATATPRPEFLMHDPMADTSLMFANSGGLNENPQPFDSTTMNRGYWNQDYAVWRTPNIVTFHIIAFYCTGFNGDVCDAAHPNVGIAPLDIEESADDVSWCVPGHSQDPQPVPGHAYWTKVTWAFNSACVVNATYLRITYANTDETFPVWSPALGDVYITYQP